MEPWIAFRNTLSCYFLENMLVATIRFSCKTPSRTQSNIDLSSYASVYTHYLGLVLPPWKEPHFPLFSLEIQDFLFFIRGFSEMSSFVRLQHSQELHLRTHLLYGRLRPSFHDGLRIRSSVDPCRSFDLWTSRKRLPRATIHFSRDPCRSSVSPYCLLQNM